MKPQKEQHTIVATNTLIGGDEMNTYEIMEQAQSDAKYLNRLNKHDFWMLLFPDSIEEYVDNKWDLFQRGIMEFMWSCSIDKLQLLAEYIDECKG